MRLNCWKTGQVGLGKIDVITICDQQASSDCNQAFDIARHSSISMLIEVGFGLFPLVSCSLRITCIDAEMADLIPDMKASAVLI